MEKFDLFYVGDNGNLLTYHFSKDDFDKAIDAFCDCVKRGVRCRLVRVTESVVCENY